jgi:hypothetical protein
MGTASFSESVSSLPLLVDPDPDPDDSESDSALALAFEVFRTGFSDSDDSDFSDSDVSSSEESESEDSCTTGLGALDPLRLLGGADGAGFSALTFDFDGF